MLADYNLGQWRGTEALEILRQEGLDIPLILVSGALGDVTAVECIKQGVTDYVLKDSLARLSVALRGALKDKDARAERKRAQESLAEKVEELARSNADLEQFAYVASHDLQEPLRMVSAYTQLLAERYRGRLDDQADKYIDYAIDGATRMQSLIQDLLAFSRVGRQENAIAARTATVGGQRHGEPAGRDPGERGGGHPWAFAPPDGQRFATATGVSEPDRKRPQISRRSRVPVIAISASKQGAEWVFSVADNGIGISAEYAENVFIIFNRLHTRTEYPGNGIGLAICKKIVERHGGKIQAMPHAGGGTIFNSPCRPENPLPKDRARHDDNGV